MYLLPITLCPILDCWTRLFTFFLQAWVICSISHFYSVCCTRGMWIVWKGTYFLPNHQFSKVINISFLFTIWIQCLVDKWWELWRLSGNGNCHWYSNKSSSGTNKKANELQSIRMILYTCTTINFFKKIGTKYYNNLKDFIFDFNELLYIWQVLFWNRDHMF